MAIRSLSDLEAEWESIHTANSPHGSSSIFNTTIHTVVSGALVAVTNDDDDSSSSSSSSTTATTIINQSDGCKSGGWASATTTTIMTIYPFVVRHATTQGKSNFSMDAWVRAIAEQLAAQVHPVPCELFARTTATASTCVRGDCKKKSSTAASGAALTGADVLAAASASVVYFCVSVEDADAFRF